MHLLQTQGFRTWSSGDVVELHLPMRTILSRGFHHSATLSRGPLVFSCTPGGTWVKLRVRGMTTDWQVFPQRQCNYVLRVNEISASALPVHESTVGAVPFSACALACACVYPLTYLIHGAQKMELPVLCLSMQRLERLLPKNRMKNFTDLVAVKRFNPSLRANSALRFARKVFQWLCCVGSSPSCC